MGETKVERNLILTPADEVALSAGDDEDFWRTEEEEEGNWQSSGSTRKASATKQNKEPQGEPQELTKKQRETRRKREKARQVKEEMREAQQEGGLHRRWGGDKQ